jgi:hypothetical protein
MNNNILKITLKIIKYIFMLGFFVLLFLFFSWWGLIGYIIFVILLVIKILYSRWDDYKAVTKYGVIQLDKVLGGKKNDKIKKTFK